MPENAMSAGLKGMHTLSIDFVHQNAESTLAFAGKISNAKTIQEILALQAQYVQDRMQGFDAQTQQLFSLIREALEQSKSGAMHAALSATSSNPTIVAATSLSLRGRANRRRRHSEALLSAGSKNGRGTIYPGASALEAKSAQVRTALRWVDTDAPKVDRKSSW